MKEKTRFEYGLELEREGWKWLQKERPALIFLDRNVRYRMGEVDLVYLDPLDGPKGTVVFCEVRTRKGEAKVEDEAFDPEAFLGLQKIRRLRRASFAFLLSWRGRPKLGAREVRYDLLLKRGSRWCIFEDIF